MPPGVADAVDLMLDSDHSPPSSCSPGSGSSSATEPCELHILESPLSNGLVAHWDVMQEVFEQTYKEKLKVNASDHPVFIADSPLTTSYMREKMAEMMFETFDVPALYVKDTAALSMYCTGLATGVVVESGHASTYTCVVHEGRTLKNTIPKTFYSGKDVTKYLSCMLSGHKQDTVTVDIEPFAKDMKEQFCFVSQDYKVDLLAAQSSDVFEAKYYFPNGEFVTLNRERLVPAESIFRPNIFNCNCPGIHAQIVRTLKLAEPNIRKCACANIVLSGGNTMFPGFNHRLQIELDKIMPSVLKSTVVEYPDQFYAAWTGGSKMAASETMTSEWITREEYDSIGSAVVKIKCK